MITYIPNDNSSGPPSYASLDVLRQSDVVEKELQKEVRLLLLVTNNITGNCKTSEDIITKLGFQNCRLTLRVNEESLLAGDWVSANNRVLGSDGFTTSNASASNAVVDLLNTGVDSPQTVKSLAELRGQTTICQSHVGEQSVTTASRTIEQIQECGAGRLLLEGHIRVPCDGVSVTL